MDAQLEGKIDKLLQLLEPPKKKPEPTEAEKRKYYGNWIEQKYLRKNLKLK